MTAVDGSPGRDPAGDSEAGTQTSMYDPLRLCIVATAAALGWLLGPVALLAFAGLGFVGYWQARRAGLKTSKCVLRDTRLVLGYLAVLGIAAAWGIYSWIS